MALAGAASEVQPLPLRPTAPLPGDCCGTGCCPCVHDLYQEDLEDWKRQCDAIKRGCSLPSAGNLLSENDEKVIFPDHYTKFELTEIEKVSSNSFVYTFRIPNNGSLHLKVGQHIILQQQKENGYNISRQYTPISNLNERGTFKVLIKLYEKGSMSQLIKKWEVGAMVPWRGPFGRFSYTRNSFKKLLLLGAGTGIAPLYQVIQYILNDDEEEIVMTLLYSSKSFSDILLRKELLEYSRYWNFSVRHFLSDESNMSLKQYQENVELRRLTKDDVKTDIKNGPVEQTLVLICGTKSFTKDMINCTKDLNLSENQVFKF